MKKGFWSKLKKPIISLAPMLDVTDSAFRQVIAKRGAPDVFFTWFVSADGLASIGKDNLLPDLYFDPKERPIVAQIFGAKPENFSIATKIIKDLKFDGIDINLGCPEKKVLKQNAGSALIDNPRLAKKIISATIDASGGLPESRKGAGLPVSVKTRLGNKTNVSIKWAKLLASTEVSAITIHGRLAKDKSQYPADWEQISAFAKAVKSVNPQILVFGNGDVKSIAEAESKAKQYNLDGIMIGRASFGNPWIFNKKISKSDLPPQKIIKALLEHLNLFNRLHQHRHFALMKKHFASYITGWSGAKQLRIKLMKVENYSQAKQVLDSYLKKLD